MALLLHDCNTVLASGIGPYPLAILERSGVHVVVMEGLAKEGVEATLSGKPYRKSFCVRQAIAASASNAAGAAWGADNQ
jgi:predicted Fe-Mo cluster-binding NifX family protein